MKKIFVLLNVLVLCYVVNAQPGRWNRNSTPFEFVWQITDSMNRIPLDTLTNAADGSIAMKNHGLWFKDTIWKKVAYLTDVTGGGGGGGIWGGITGTLSDQGDLQAALDLKLRISDSSGMLSAYVRSIGNLSPLFTASIASHGITFSLSNASPYTVFGRGTGTGAPSYISSLDSNWIPALHTQAYYDARYIQNPIGGGGGTFNFTDGLQQLGNNVVALHDLGLWNARKFQGFDIQPGSPSDGDFYVFRQSCNCYDFTNIDEVGGGGGGGGGGGSVTNFLNVDTTYHRLATVVDSSNAVLKSIRFDQLGGEFSPTEETDSTLKFNFSVFNFDSLFSNYLLSGEANITTGNIATVFSGYVYSNFFETSADPLGAGFQVSSIDGFTYPVAWLHAQNISGTSVYGSLFLHDTTSGSSGAAINTVEVRAVPNVTGHRTLFLPNETLDTLATHGWVNSQLVSDLRLKEVHGFYEGGIDVIKKLHPINFSWNKQSGLNTAGNHIGFSAQEVQSVLGDGSVAQTKDGYLMLQDRSIMAALVNAVKEQQQEIIQLKKDIEELKAKK